MKNLFLLPFDLVPWLCLGTLLPIALTGCGIAGKVEAEAQSGPPQSQQRAQQRPTTVDAALARTGVLQEPTQYIGTTRPVREISLRSQVEGRLLNLAVNIGDRIARGQILAILDDSLLLTAVTQAQAELAARESEVARAQTQVSNARARAQQAKVELQQAKTNSRRRQYLQQEGAISKQDAELAQTAAQSGEQVLRAAEEQIRTEQQAVAAAQGRVRVQQAIIAQAKERQSYARVISPIKGVVLERVTEPGNLVQPGGEVLKLGDFSRVKVVVPVSELELSNIRVGQLVQVRLDAFANETFSGAVSRISPAADATARQVPVEITIPNSNDKIGSGLLARVSFSQLSRPKVIVPQTAVLGAGERGSGGAGGQGSGGAGERGGRGAGGQRSGGAGEQGSRADSTLRTQDSGLSTLFVVKGEGKEVKVEARQVQVGSSANGKVEILSGLNQGERYAVKSSKPLKNGETVLLSILSETSEQRKQP
ncbi:efflux RND transporter periplasmic adaptor subunit [Argonema antarcticum]|uniref:efflux RND transporter periplasmic adaptor subunit n=1 Tax=Argonema antarcticum TaxID=2942763 RepID=UPI0020135613|nr:efflux RND transporter periplasmic adaptor subunit [Argonema antarcticum A004/B2]